MTYFSQKKLDKAEKIANKAILRLQNEITFRNNDANYDEFTEYPVPKSMLQPTLDIWTEFLKVVYILQSAENRASTWYKYIEKMSSKQFEDLLTLVDRYL